MKKLNFREYSKNFCITKHGINGPLLITRVLKSICDTENVKEMSPDVCEGFHVLKKFICYPIWTLRQNYPFEVQHFNYTMRAIRKSHMIHIWGNLNKENSLNINETTAYVFLAKNYCPKVFHTIVDQF